MEKQALLDAMADAVESCHPEAATKAAKEALDSGMDPVEAINQGLVVGMDRISEHYAAREMYLPQVLVAAHAMYNGLDILLPAIPKSSLAETKKAEACVVMGDVHDIGKNIVKTMLTAAGYLVTDLGKDVDPKVIADTAKENGIKVVCLSTLMTPTMDSMAQALKELEKNGYRDKCTVTIGGPPTSDAFAKEIGADHRDTDASNCVKWLKEEGL